MLGLWSAAVYHAVDDQDYGINTGVRPEDDDRERKRQRRSIFFAQPDTDSSDDGDDYDVGHNRSFDCRNGKIDTARAASAAVPSTPYAADPLSKGACLLTPSFPRRSSSPCLGSTSTFVAVHEEPNSGFRHYMEDRSAAMTADGVAYLGIYDGHGGVDASTFLQRHLLPTIQAHLHPGCDVHDALTAAYMATNAAFRATGSIQGSTATTVILRNSRLIAANVGDSPAFVVKKSGEVYSVIQEHKIEGEEAARIAAQGVPIYRSPTGPAYMGTPDGTRWLNMSRAFGDFVYPAISCEPHICCLDVSDGKYLVMGSDGLTEKWPVAEAAQYLTQLAGAGWSLPAICRSLVEQSLAHGSTDNISCMIVDLEAYMLHAEAAPPPERERSASAEAAGGRAAAVRATAGAAPARRLVLDSGAEGQQQQHELGGDGDRWPQRCVEDDGTEENDGTEESASFQQLLCEEEALGEQTRSGAVGFRAACEVGVMGTRAALACCAATVLGIVSEGVPDSSVRCRRADLLVCVDGTAAFVREPDESEAVTTGDASPACSSPDVSAKLLQPPDCEPEATAHKRQATPQPAPTACRLPAPTVVEAATGVWADGDVADGGAV